MNLFAILETDITTEIKRIPLSAGVNGEVTNYFTNLIVNYFYEKEVVPFDGNYKVEEDELFTIEGYELSEEIIDSGTNGMAYETLDLNDEGKIKAIYYVFDNNGNKEFYFQHFDTRKLIAFRGIPLYFNRDTYSKIRDKGLLIHGGLTCVHKEGSLFFESYYKSRMVLPLQDYYIEATNDEVENFANSNLLNFDDQIGFEENVSSTLRKKIKAIRERGVLDNITLDEVQRQAELVNIEFEIENNQIKVPSDKQYIKRLIKFLDEDYFKTPLTNRVCVASSKREV